VKIAVDIDGTIDSNPDQMRSIMSAMQQAGHHVVVLTGTSEPPATKADWDTKATYLRSLGCGSCWDQLVVIAHETGNLAAAKADWCVDNGVDLLIDNNKENAKQATKAGIPLVLVPWASRTN
jgi:hypothetical protein